MVVLHTAQLKVAKDGRTLVSQVPHFSLLDQSRWQHLLALGFVYPECVRSHASDAFRQG